MINIIPKVCAERYPNQYDNGRQTPVQISGTMIATAMENAQLSTLKSWKIMNDTILKIMLPKALIATVYTTEIYLLATTVKSFLT
jgi:hypothetical protein